MLSPGRIEARYPRRTVSDNLGAPCRPESIGADQRAPSHITFCGLHGDAIAMIDEAEYLHVCRRPDQIRTEAGIQKNPVKVRPMNQRVGMRKTVKELIVKRNGDDLFSRDAVHHDQPLRHRCFGANRLGDAKSLENMKGIGSDLNPAPISLISDARSKR